MFTLPSSSALQFLLDRQLMNISFNKHQVTLTFDPEARIVLGTSVAVNRQVYRDTLDAVRATMHLLHEKVTEVSSEPSDTLRLVYGNGDEMCIIGESAEYENYEIHGPGRFIVV